MNKGYTYIDGKVIISDEFGNHTQSEYYDNLDKVLVQENVIEEIEKKIQELTEKNKNFKVKRFIPISLIGFVTGVSLTPFTLWAISGGINPFTTQVDTIMGTMSNAGLYTFVMAAACIPLVLLLSFREYKDYKDYIRNGNAINCELDFLNLQLEKEKEKLINLEKERTRNNEDTKTYSKLVDDKKQLEALRKLLETYYEIGYNSEKYYRYYQQGKLEEKLQSYYRYYPQGKMEEKLQRYYSDLEIKLAKEYLEQKGPSLVKKRNKSK